MKTSRLCILMVLQLVAAFGAVSAHAQDAAVTTPTVYEITLDARMINPATADYIVSAVEKAEKDDAAALLIRIDTPGGLLQSTRAIVRAMLASKVPILTYVFPGGAQAGSAGVFVTLAGHIAAMAPGTNIGAAHPITGQGEDIEKSGGKDLAKKVENDTRAFMESIATERGRNAKWAAQAVTQSVSVTAPEALRLHVIDLIADSTVDLLAKADGRVVRIGKDEMTLRTRGARVVEIPMNLKQQLVDRLADPNLAYLLMSIGMLGIYIEFSHPGAIFPGVVGGISLLLAFVALQILPFNAGGLALIVLAAGFFIAEIFVTSYGLLSVAGVIAMGLGGLLLFDTPDAAFQVNTGLIFAVAAAFGVVALAVGFLVAKTYRRKVETGVEGMIGKIAEVTTELAPRGTVFVNGELWSAEATTSVPKGEEVVVTAVDGMLLRVAKREK
jgi:membrane-bound serine protease (ClpP class)